MGWCEWDAGGSGPPGNRSVAYCLDGKSQVFPDIYNNRNAIIIKA